MDAKVIFYSQKRIKPNERTKFKKELAGHDDASHGGRYTYRVDGILDSIWYIKPANATLILKKEDYKKAVTLMKKYLIDYEVYDITVPKSKLKE